MAELSCPQLVLLITEGSKIYLFEWFPPNKPLVLVPGSFLLPLII
ncbi:hypothetical protein SynSYN20_01498 [Synechococcus sp. SYN20]|nr:hypothetical protein SynSYN20_01498 [Synechococcus sp. SYN20]